MDVGVGTIAPAYSAVEFFGRVDGAHVQYGLLEQAHGGTLRVPALAEHSEDVPDLLKFYVDYFVSREKLPFRKFSVAVQNFLRNYPWHGNIRELKNLVQRLLILGSGEEVDLDEVKTALGESVADPVMPGHQPDFYDLPLKEARERFAGNQVQGQTLMVSENRSRLALLESAHFRHRAYYA